MILKCILMKWDEGMDLIDLAEDKDRWGVVTKAVMNFRVPKNAGEFLDLAREY
jgi:hypothetical protein